MDAMTHYYIGCIYLVCKINNHVSLSRVCYRGCCCDVRMASKDPGISESRSDQSSVIENQPKALLKQPVQTVG